MASTEELEAQILAEMESNPEAYAVEENNFLLIDNDLRTISIPEGIKNLGVESDDDVHRLYFQMPKTYGEFDLSTFDIRINYKNGNIGDVYAVEDKNAEGDVITFSWLVGRNAVRTKGTTQFIVCLKKSDSSGIVQQEFNTTVASLNVLEGLETTEQVIQANADIIEQILKKIDGLTSISQEDIANAVADWMTEHPPSGMTAEEKAQLNKNTEDISSLSEDMENLKNNGTGTGSGVSTAQANSLWAIIQKTAFAEQLTEEEINTFKTSWGITTENIPATGISLDKTTLSFTDSATQTLIATVEPSNSTDKITWESSDTGIATVSGGVVTPVSNGSCTITAKAGSYSASCAVTVNVAGEITTYTVTNNLTNVSTDNPVTTINKNSGYMATLTPDSGYEFSSVTVIMGGSDITSTVYSNGVITIDSVTGNVVITASAVLSGSTEEIVLLKSITGDGNSYIDTEVLADVGHRYEFSMKLSEPTKYFFGADMYNVGIPYKNLYLSNVEKMSLRCMINGRNIGNIGTWNGTDANLLTNKQFYFVMKSGLQAVYLDAEYTTQQTNVTNGNTSFGDSETLPIIPLYLFKVNYNEQTNPGNAANYVPSDTTVYWLKIYDDSENTLLHEFVPAKQGTKIGMYDTVSQKFHENKGTGTFGYEEVDA